MTQLVTNIVNGSFKSLARAISLVENEVDGYMDILQALPPASNSIIIGITGPPGAGKSTLVDAMIQEMTDVGKTVGVLCVDPSSPFNFGALLGDRIRMSNWYNHKNVFIRSLATRGSLGGLHPSIIQITDVMKAFAFDCIIVETVGVGQSEVDIAGLADTTVIVLVPEAGDEIQTMKAGLMEIANIFVVNKADRPGADTFVKNVRSIIKQDHGSNNWTPPVIKTVAPEKKGIDTLMEQIMLHNQIVNQNTRKYFSLTDKAYLLIQNKRMKDVKKDVLLGLLKTAAEKPGFNLYSFVDQF